MCSIHFLVGGRNEVGVVVVVGGGGGWRYWFGGCFACVGCFTIFGGYGTVQGAINNGGVVRWDFRFKKK